MKHLVLVFFPLLIFSSLTSGIPLQLSAAPSHSAAFIQKKSSDKMPIQFSKQKLTGSQALIRAEQSLTGIKKLKADVKFHVFLKTLGFPFTLRAVYRYTPSGHVKLTFHGIPAFFSSIMNKSLKASLDPSGLPLNYETDYKIEFSKPEKIGSISCLLIKLTPTAHAGPIQNTSLWISETNYTIPKETIAYFDGMEVTVYRKYAFIHHHYLTIKAHADLNDSKESDLNASVMAVFKDYKVND